MVYYSAHGAHGVHALCETFSGVSQKGVQIQALMKAVGSTALPLYGGHLARGCLSRCILSTSYRPETDQNVIGTQGQWEFPGQQE